MKSTHSLFLVVLLAACGGTPPVTGTDAAARDAGTSDAAASDTGVVPGEDAAVVTGDTGVVEADANVTGEDAAVVVSCDPRTFVVSTPGFAYTFEELGVNPALTLCAGVTYTFDLTEVGTTHPMQITAGGILQMAIPAGAVTEYTVPASGTQPDAYSCVPHGFGGAIVVP